jgi:hypothetical protein
METNYLQNKKVSVKIVEKQRSGFLKNSDGNTIWTGCKRTYQAPTNQFDRIIQLLNKDEQAWFEKEMGLETGSLAASARKNNFWREFKVILDKKGKILDLSDPEDFLSWKVLLASNTIANSKSEINPMIHDFYMVTEEEEQEVDSRLAEKYEEASLLFSKISKSDKKMKSVLRLLGKGNIPSDANTKWLKAELVKVIEQKEKIHGVPGTTDFIRVANDPNFDIKIFLLDAIEIGEIFIEGTTYKLRAGDVIGYDHDQAISFLNNPKNQQTKLLIEERIKNNK